MTKKQTVLPKREIKYRGWDEKRGKMIYFTEMDFCDEYNSLEFRVEDWRIGEEKLGLGDLDLRGRDIPIMQYIGLLDKRGKEIYEGDILFNEGDRYNYVIKWDENEGGWSLGEDGCLLSKYQLPVFWEVIGNIFENPNLTYK